MRLLVKVRVRARVRARTTWGRGRVRARVELGRRAETSWNMTTAALAHTPTLSLSLITCGFQSLSNRITTSAEARLIPTPPARVEMRYAI